MRRGQKRGKGQEVERGCGFSRGKRGVAIYAFTELLKSAGRCTLELYLLLVALRFVFMDSVR